MSLRLDSSRRLSPAGRDIVVVLSISCLARAVFWILFEDAQSNDVAHWRIVLDAVDEGRNPYETGLLNWPPLWLGILVALDAVAGLLHVSFVTALRGFLILVEAGLAVALYHVLVAAGVPRAAVRRALLVGIALNPVAILLVVQHGNFDVLVGLFVVLAVGSLLANARSRRHGHWLAGSLFLGLGVLAKTVPLVLAPILAPGARLARRADKLIGLALFLGPAALGTGVILALAPAAVIDNVLGYRSEGLYFGFWGVFSAAGHEEVVRALGWVPPVAFAVVIAVLSRRLYDEPPLDRERLFLLVALLLLSVPVLGAAYAPQYAYWFLPAFIGTYVLLDGEWRVLLRLAYVVMCVTYLWGYAVLLHYGQFAERFAGGSEWLADVTDVAETVGMQMLVHLPLFAVAVVILVEGVRRLARPRAESRPVVPRATASRADDFGRLS